jgi:hypothetical protein
MSPNPDLAEWVVHWLDLSYGVACVLFLAVAAWALAAEVRARRRARVSLFGPWPGEGRLPREGRP